MMCADSINRRRRVAKMFFPDVCISFVDDGEALNLQVRCGGTKWERKFIAQEADMKRRGLIA